MQIENRTAFITGGASGLGEAVTRHLHSLGANVVVVDRSAKRGHALQEALAERILFVPADVAEEESMSKAVRLAVEKFEALHIAVCCAGIAPAKRVLGRDGIMPLELFAETIQVNLVGCFNAVRLAAEAMMINAREGDGERGVVIMTSSIAAREGQVGQAAYAASKGGVDSLTLPLAREFSPLGIRVMTIAPGLFNTPMMDSISDEAKESLAGQIPFPQRLGRPVEFARLVAEVIGNRMLNGSVIRLDGALRMGPK
ncbi:MAG: SDR family NAD(P)-dependent oxidoreductase [Deltaproteobacteria bacterium]|nr:SDR family NAD(P)-dependent oxidoreductase [Deltaproteobacteria bacterium]